MTNLRNRLRVCNYTTTDDDKDSPTFGEKIYTGHALQYRQEYGGWVDIPVVEQHDK
ncbi:hypothetical protein DB2_2 [Octadecabacter Antarctic DB virus 2]|nr:hypothetical protein DB2_2 [Octadecabacter Antarctic DB virus 2]